MQKNIPGTHEICVQNLIMEHSDISVILEYMYIWTTYLNKGCLTTFNCSLLF